MTMLSRIRFLQVFIGRGYTGLVINYQFENIIRKFLWFELQGLEIAGWATQSEKPWVMFLLSIFQSDPMVPRDNNSVKA